jgi:prevent-host-death family protein
MDWQLADAKNRFSELVNRALADGPQRVRCRGDAVIVVAQRDFDKLTVERIGFKQFLLAKGPSLQGLDLSRDRSRTIGSHHAALSGNTLNRRRFEIR